MNTYGKKILSVGAPENPLDAANKSYVDTAIASIDTKADGINTSARNEFEQTSGYINSVSTTLSGTVKADYALTADGKFLTLSAGKIDAGSVESPTMSATTVKADKLEGRSLGINNGEVMLSTTATDLSIHTTNGAAGLYINGTSLESRFTDVYTTIASNAENATLCTETAESNAKTYADNKVTDARTDFTANLLA